MAQNDQDDKLNRVREEEESALLEMVAFIPLPIHCEIFIFSRENNLFLNLRSLKSSKARVLTLIKITKIKTVTTY
jgi:hypothetical protein